MYEIIPSPGTNNNTFAEIKKKIELVHSFAKTIHIDVVDGKFAPHATFADPEPFKDLIAAYPELTFEVHLMVEEPISHLKAWGDAGFHRFIGQVEKMSDQTAFVADAQMLGDVVLALDKQTSVDAITVPLIDLDGLLVMTIQAGQSGQHFEEILLDKVKQLRAKTDLPIEVDGGINDETIAIAAAAGATRFVATSFLYSLKTPEEQVALLTEQLAHVPQESF